MTEYVTQELFETNEYIKKTFSYVRNLNEANTVWVAKNKVDQLDYVMRLVSMESEPLFRELNRRPPMGIPQVFELLHVHTGGTSYLLVVEEYVRAETLTAYIEKKKLSEEKLIALSAGLADILSALHKKHPPIIHRDIKPDNILVAQNGLPFLIDFGIARSYTGAKERDTTIMGTEGFAAPEQFGFAESDARTDIYGLGATVRYVKEAGKVSSSKLTSFINQCTSIDPEKRFQTMEEAADFLRGKKRSVAEKTLQKLPGFRQGIPGHMITAVCGYFFIFYLCLRFNFSESTDGTTHTVGELWTYRIVLLFTMLSMVFVNCNYNGIRDNILHFREKSPGMKVVYIILINGMLMFAGLCLIVAITSLPFIK